MKARTTKGIALRPTDHVQGSNYFYALNTARRVTARNGTALPMPADVIKFLNKQRIVIEMVRRSIYWLNTFPPKDGVSTTLSPSDIITGTYLSGR